MNKKLLILLTLIAALALTFIACENTPDLPADTTVATDEVTAPATDAPTEAETEEVTEPSTEEATTEEITTEEVTIGEVTTEEVTTEEVTIEEVTTEEVTTEEVTTEEVVESVDIDLTAVTATGSFPVVDSAANGPALGLGEDKHVITLHYGSIDLGEMDLSKYSKVTVTYATPVDGFTSEYEATGKRVLLLNTPNAVEEGAAFELLPAEDAIIVAQHYEISTTQNAIMTVEIDLTDVDYNGRVLLSFDARNAENGYGAIGYLVYVVGITFA